MNVDAIQSANVWYVWLVIRDTQLSSPTCSSTNRPIRETSIGHPTPRKTRALASSHRRSLPGEHVELMP